MHLAIIGNGITGVSAALRVRARRSDWRITLISGESKYHYSRPALMYVFMGHMRYEDTKPYPDSFWAEQRIDLVRGWVTGVDLERKRLSLHGAPAIHWDKLLIATGSKPNRFGWPGQDLEGVQGLWGLHDLKRLYANVEHARRAVIVGGGLIGIELGEMLHSAGLPVTFLIREPEYWSNVLPLEEAALVSRHVERHGFDLRRETQLAEIEGDGQGRARAVRTSAGERIACELVGLTAGVSPNLDLVRDTEIPTVRGVLVDRSLRTRVPDVYAAGDCAEIVDPEGGTSLVQQVWYTGKQQGELVGDVIAGEERLYEPGVWFNSAKFLDLEYQTYGRVDLDVPDARSLLWTDPERSLAVRVVHVDGRVIGFNLLGLRWRHEVCERWISQRHDVRTVLDELARASFDSELARRYEPEIARTLRRALEGEEVPA